jgi:DNA polymerase III subunit delta'
MRFAEVIGHTEIGARLRNGAQSNRVAHAQLFDGPEGSGTLALALAYARFLHCTERTEADSCGQCSSCRSYDSLQHPDLHWSFPFFKKDGGEHATSQPFQAAWRLRMLTGPYFGQSEWLDVIGADKKQLFISVQEALEINRKLGLKSFQGGWKVLICWLPETMRVDTANKMLKLIEEPTDRTVMLFVSEHFDQLLATIRSRVQTIRVPRLSDAEAASGLVNQFDVDAALAAQWVQVVEGNVAAALRLQQSEGSGADYGLFVRWMRACYGQDSPAMVELAEEVSKMGREVMKRFFIYSMHMVRQCIVGNYGAMELVRLTDEERGFAEKFAPFIHHDNVLGLQSLLEKAHRDIAGNVNGRLVFLDLSVQVNMLLRKTA